MPGERRQHVQARPGVGTTGGIGGGGQHANRDSSVKREGHRAKTQNAKVLTSSQIGALLFTIAPGTAKALRDYEID